MQSYTARLIANAIGGGTPGSVEKLEERTLLAFVMEGSQPAGESRSIPVLLDSDELVDMVSFSLAGRALVPWFRQTDDTLVASQSVSIPGNDTLGTPFAFDIDQDGDSDILLSTYLFRNNGSGTLTYDDQTPVPAISRDRVIDLDRDGWLDVISRTDEASFAVYFGRLGGFEDRFDFGAGFASAPSAVVGVADIDMDGRLDIQFHNRYLNTVMTLRQVPGRRFDHIGSRSVHPDTTVYDMNGDGRADYVRREGDVHLIEYTTQSGPSTMVRAFLGRPASAISAEDSTFVYKDIDRDGLADVVTFVRNPSGAYTNVDTYVFLQVNTSGLFTAPILVHAGGYRFTNTTWQNSLLVLDSWSDMNGDSVLDALIVTTSGGNVGGYGWTSTTTRWSYGKIAPAPLIMSGSGQQFPNADSTISIRASGAWGELLTQIDLYADSNNNNRWDPSDALVASQMTTISPATVTVSVPPADQARYRRNFFAVARSATTTSDPALISLAPWDRLFMPEGFRTIDWVDEHVPLINPNSFDVPYSIVLHYAEAIPSQVLFTGVLAANSRGGHSISLRGRADVSAAIPNTPYAVEVLSQGKIGATMVRSDSFGRPGPGWVVSAESFTDTPRSNLVFAGLAHDSLDFITVFNPTPTEQRVRVTYFEQGQTLATTIRFVRGLSRDGFATFDEPELTGRTGVTALVEADSIVAAFSRHEPALRRGQFVMGGEITTSKPATLAVADLSAGAQPRLLATNTAFVPRTVDFQVVADQTSLVLQRIIPARSTITLTLLDVVPAGTHTVAVSVSNTPGLASQLLGVDPVSADTWATTLPQTPEHRWLFADNFLNRGALGTSSAETLHFFNPTLGGATVSIRLLTPNGGTVSAGVWLPAESARSVRLHELAEIAALPMLAWFSTLVTSDAPIHAWLMHTDMNFGGTWAAAGQRWL